MGRHSASLGPTRSICRRWDRPTLEAGNADPLASPSRGSLFCLSCSAATEGLAFAEISNVFEPADTFVKSFGFTLEESLLGFDVDLDRVVIRHVLHLDAKHGQYDWQAQPRKDIREGLD